MHKHLGLFLIVFMINIQSYSSHIFVSGAVSGSWDVDTVFVTDNLKILNGQVLIIPPGTFVQFQGYYRMKVEGQVLALGMVNDSIVFTINDTTGFYSFETGDGGWRGLWFDHLAPVNDSSLFNFCKFEFSKAVLDSDSTNWYGGVACIRDFDQLRFSHCRFVNNRAYKNGGAIYAREANIKVDHCSFQNNFCGQATLYGYGGGICLEYSDAVIFRNYFTLNSSTGVGGGLSFEYSDPVIESNHFYDNYSAIGGGFVCLRSSGLNPIVNNLVEANSSLFFGGGIAVLETTLPFINNTIVANFSGAGGGLYFNVNSFAIFWNCVVWDNYDLGGAGPQVYIWDTFSAPEFYYCVMEGGVEQFGGTGGGSGGFIGVYEDCYEVDPNFAGGGDHPYQPAQNSICINNGTPDTSGLSLPEYDFAGNIRIMNYYIDIGAYETLVITGEQETLSETGRIKVFPNPFASEVNIFFNIEETQFVQILIIDARGNVVRELENSLISPEFYQSQWRIDDESATKLPTGVYYLKVSRGQNNETLKLLHSGVK
jgi:predicted outer membrane repeat protein